MKSSTFGLGVRHLIVLIIMYLFFLLHVTFNFPNFPRFFCIWISSVEVLQARRSRWVLRVHVIQFFIAMNAGRSVGRLMYQLVTVFSSFLLRNINSWEGRGNIVTPFAIFFLFYKAKSCLRINYCSLCTIYQRTVGHISRLATSPPLIRS